MKGCWLQVAAVKQSDIEVLRNVASYWNFVSAGAMRQKLALLVPNALFHGEPAHALHVATFNLAFVDGGVDALTCVVNNVHSLQPPFSRASINSTSLTDAP